MLPQTLQQLILDAKQEVLADRHHDLSTEKHVAVQKAVGPLIGRSHLQDRTHLRQITLIILTAQRILPFWEEVYPVNRSPQRLLEGLEQIKAGTMNPEVLRPELDRFDEMMAQAGRATQDEWHIRNPDPGRYLMEAEHRASIAGAAISNGITAIVIDLDEESAEPGGALSSAYTSVRMASTAYAGGLPENPLANSGKRLEFWEWWLIEAVPMAWMSAPE
jgi:hypothetical protein